MLCKSETLHNGVEIPVLGYRIDRDFKESMYDNIRHAIDAGFRHFDIPVDPASEEIIQKAFSDSRIARSELFLTAKLTNEDHGFNAAIRSFEHSLKRLKTDYLDLYLINWPNPVKFRDQYETNSLETWRALEEIYKSGRAHAIGVANFQARHIEHLLDHVEIAPMVNQARLYPGFPFEDNINCAVSHNIQTIGFLPPYHQDILNARELRIMADKYGVTSRHICIRYMLEKNCLALCQGSDIAELKELVKVFDFSISEEDMHYLDGIRNYGLDNIDPDTCDF